MGVNAELPVPTLSASIGSSSPGIVWGCRGAERPSFDLAALKEFFFLAEIRGGVELRTVNFGSNCFPSSYHLMVDHFKTVPPNTQVKLAQMRVSLRHLLRWFILVRPGECPLLIVPKNPHLV